MSSNHIGPLRLLKLLRVDVDFVLQGASRRKRNRAVPIARKEQCACMVAWCAAIGFGGLVLRHLVLTAIVMTSSPPMPPPRDASTKSVLRLTLPTSLTKLPPGGREDRARPSRCRVAQCTCGHPSTGDADVPLGAKRRTLAKPSGLHFVERQPT